jgi:tryptophan synthase alpha subunit
MENKVMKFHHAIEKANKEGRLGLIIYVVPNYPDPTQFGTILSLLDATGFVSIIETTIPTADGFSDHANDIIRLAHIGACRHTAAAASLTRPNKPALCVLYKGTVEKSSFEQVIIENKGAWEGLILEWSEENNAPYVETANRHGMELVQCVGPWMSVQRIRKILSMTIPEPLIYLMSAPMTGAKLFGHDEMKRCIETIRSICPAAKIAAGFGVRKAGDIRALSAIEGLDAVIIGTAFLETMGRGHQAVVEFLRPLESALTR